MNRAIEYINKIAPEHSRTSCDDQYQGNEQFGVEDCGGCYRCTLLWVARLTVGVEREGQPAQQGERNA